MVFSSSNPATYIKSLINMPNNIKEGDTFMPGRCLVDVLLLSNDRKQLLQ